MQNSKSQRILKISLKYKKLTLRNQFPQSNKHPSSVLLLNYGTNLNSSANKLKLASTCNFNNELKRRTLYDNIHIFHKRQLAFDKMIEAKKKVFKYTNFSLFNEKERTSRNRRNLRLNKKIEMNTGIDFSQLFLTDNDSLFPILNSKSLTKDIFDRHNNFINQTKKKDKNNEKINYSIKKKPITKLQRNNIHKKLNIFTYLKNSELAKSRYMNDFNMYLTNKLHFKTKAEKLKILLENDQEKIEQLNNKINALKRDFSGFNDTFYHKFSQYVKEIYNNKETEKERNNTYIEQLIILKNTVNILQAAVNKIKNNANSFNHWLYLQICLKEKKISLPQSYKDILESKDEDKDSLINKYGEELFNHVKKYKNNIPYQDADEFLNQFDFYENKNLELLNKYHVLRTEIRDKENEKNILEKYYDFEKYEKEFNELLNSKMKVYNKLKFENNNLEEHKQILIAKKYKAKINDNITTKKHSKIYNKTQQILSNIKSLSNYTFKKEAINKTTIRKISEQQLILFNLSKIEIIIDILVKKNKSYKEIYPEKMYELKILLDREKKYIKNIEQLNNIKMQYEEETRKIIKKYEKILILPTHKININNFRNQKNINSVNHSTKASKNKNKSMEDIDDYFN